MNGLVINRSRVVVPLLGGRNLGRAWGQATAADRVLHRAVAGEGGCVVFVGSQNRNGYGIVRDGSRKARMAHRVVYEALVGAIPDGLTIDHLCRNRACVNPAHMEAVSAQLNTLRGQGPTAINATKSHCDSGHAFTDENTIHYKGKRQCRACNRAHNARRSAAVSAAAKHLGLSQREYVKANGQSRAKAESILNGLSEGNPE